MTRIIIRATLNTGRNNMVKYLRKKIPDAEWCFDQKRDAFDTFIRAKRMAGIEPCVHMEEDVLLTKNFRQKIESAIAEHPNHVIQFFSMLRDDAKLGSRWINRFSMNQCYYIPAGLNVPIAEYGERWPNREKDRNGYDVMMDEFRRDMKFKIWLHVPSLVQHMEAKSLLGPRSSKRQSGTFQDPDE